MTKQESLINLSSILNRGNATAKDTNAFFSGKKHPGLLDILEKYLQHSTKLIGNPKIYKTQSLNDRGVDLIVEFMTGAKIGFQIKSPFDVTEDGFAAKVKAQLAESQAHGLDKWILLICSPLQESKVDYSARINHLVNELSSYKSTYHAVYTPEQSHNILNTGVMPDAEFNAIKKQFILEPVDWKSLLDEIRQVKKESYLGRVEVTKGTKAVNAAAYSKYNQLDEEDRLEAVENFEYLFNKLKKLSRRTREILLTVIERGKQFGFSHKNFGALCQEIENHLHMSSDELKREVAILERYSIAGFDEDGDGNWYVAVYDKEVGYNIYEDIAQFCRKTGKRPEKIILDLDFSNFDN